jgi:putative transcriptional regulator
MDKQTMREFDALCLAPVRPLSKTQIVRIRRKVGVSQPVFAQYLNVSKSTIAQWEQGEKVPSGPALKLLNLVEQKGLDALV